VSVERAEVEWPGIVVEVRVMHPIPLDLHRAREVSQDPFHHSVRLRWPLVEGEV